MKSIHIHFLLALGFIMTLTFMWFYQIPDTLERSKNQNSLVQDENLRLSKNQKTIQKYNTVLLQYLANIQGMVSYKEVLSRDPYESQHQVSQTLEALARRHRLEITRVNYQQANATKSGLTGYTIDLPLIGSYRDFRQFLLNLKKQEPFLAIHKVAIQDLEESGQLGIELGMTCYFNEGASHDQ